MLPKTMQAAMFYGPFDLRVEEIPVPHLGPRDVLIQVQATLTCGTDVKKYKRGYPLQTPPYMLGHETAGRIVAVGKEVNERFLQRRFEEGMRVVSTNLAPCNECHYCKIGWQNVCEHQVFISGAFAEYVLIPEQVARQNLLPIPNGLSYEEAALTEPLACVIHGIEESHIHPGDTVVINGAGPMGLLFVRLAKLQGARVIATDLSAIRLEFARRFGADEVVVVGEADDQVEAIRMLTDAGRGADVAIEAVGLPGVWEKTIKMARKGGLVNLFGGCAANTSITIDTKLLHYSALTIKGVFSYKPGHAVRALEMIRWGDVDAHAFVSGRVPLAHVEDALKRILEQDGIKYSIIPPQSELAV
ncbi:MAG: zinc-binding dehydrogenase [Chloroflexi bacterium]|nr:zinc-binding dehydrogenase [Chloroflexota bacterium]MCL5075985.1 zinc-binding dehydrogenase [Chloroflexota bacterium]